MANRGGVLAVATGSLSQIGLAAVANLATTTTLSASDRGRYIFLVTALAVTAPLAGLGTSVGLRRLLPTSPSPWSLQRTYLRITVRAAAVHALVAGTMLWLLGVADVIQSPTDLPPVVVLAGGLVLSAQFVEHWYARGDFRTGATYATANAVAAVAAAATTVVAPSVQAAVWTQAVVTALINVAQYIHLRRTGAGPRPDESGAVPARTLIRVGSPSLVLTSGIALTFRLDRLILGIVAGPTAVSVYSLGASFSEMPRFVPTSFGQVAYARAAESGGRAPVRPHVLSAYRWMLPASAATAVAGLVFISTLNPVYQEAVLPLFLLLLAEFALVPFGIVMRMILGGGRVGLSAVVGGVAVVLSAVIYYVAIVRIGMLGAAISSVIIYGSLSVVCLMIYRSNVGKEGHGSSNDSAQRSDPAAGLV